MALCFFQSKNSVELSFDQLHLEGKKETNMKAGLPLRQKLLLRILHWSWLDATWIRWTHLIGRLWAASLTVWNSKASAVFVGRRDKVYNSPVISHTHTERGQRREDATPAPCDHVHEHLRPHVTPPVRCYGSVKQTVIFYRNTDGQFLKGVSPSSQHCEECSTYLNQHQLWSCSRLKKVMMPRWVKSAHVVAPSRSIYNCRVFASDWSVINMSLS